MEDNIVYPAWDTISSGRQASGQPGKGGGGPHDPMLDARVTILETQARDAREALHAMNTSMARMEVTLATLATRADTASLTAAVAGLDKRLGLIESRVETVVAQAIGKTIGGWQLVGIFASLMVLATGFYTGIRYLLTLPFMH